MTKKLLSIFLFFILCLSKINGDIFEVKDLSKFKEEVCTLDHNSLVLFDVDYTILTPKDACFKCCSKYLRRKFLHVLDPKQIEWLQSIRILEGEEELMDKAFPPLIQQIQKKNIPVIGFTALDTGKYGKIINIEDWRLNQLKKFDIDFTPAFCEINPVILTESSLYNGSYPIFKNGVLFTNRQQKGEIFTIFLGRLGWNPKKVIFIDDTIDQLESVESAANALSIEFIGFHYIAAETTPCEFDEKVGEFQLRNLIEHEQWLSDAEAKKILEQQACD